MANFGPKPKTNLFQKFQKSYFFEGVNPCFWLNQFFLFLLVKIRLQIRFNNFLDRKEEFIFVSKQNFPKSQKSHFSKGVNPCLWGKIQLFSLFVFGQNKT